MQLELISEVKDEVHRSASKRSVQLTGRDLRLLEFLCEMQFATVEDIHQRFFKVTKDGQESSSLRWTWERLSKLKAMGFLATARHFQLWKSLFLASPKGHVSCVELSREYVLPRPIASIDGRTFSHDWQLVKLRAKLEADRGAASWMSERVLRSNPGMIGGLTGEYIPDAIYTQPDGRRMAFELELSQKARRRYEHKIQRYVRWIREHRSNSDAFRKVHYMIGHEGAYRVLKELTKIYGEFFELERVEPIQLGEGGAR